MRYSIEIPGRALAKARRPGAPVRTREWEEYVGRCFMAEYGRPLLVGAVTVDITVCGKPRGDVDNLAKSILDALNGIAWHDDAQVMELKVRKADGEAPGVIVHLQQWERGVTVAAATASTDHSYAEVIGGRRS